MEPQARNELHNQRNQRNRTLKVVEPIVTAEPHEPVKWQESVEPAELAEPGADKPNQEYYWNQK